VEDHDVPDIVIDYELLNTLGKDTETLKNKVSDARIKDHNFSVSEAGTAAGDIAFYHSMWSGAFKHAWDLLESLSKTYTGVAQQWFDQDAGYAATANEQAAGFVHSMWNMKKQAYDNWQRLSHIYVTIHGFDDNGNPYEKQVPLADPNKPPEAPGTEPTQYSYTASDGSQHTTTSTYDGSGNLTSNDTTVSDGAGGMSYHEHTDFGDNGSYTSTVNHPDGSKTVETVTGDEHGIGTKTDTVTDADGKTTTTTYTGTGVNTKDPTWTDTTPHKDDGGGNGGGNGGGGGGGSNPKFYK
jgi:hypothetical protein